MTAEAIDLQDDTLHNHFRLTTPVSTSPHDQNLIDTLHEALEGGDKTWQFFAGRLEPMTKLLQTVATGGDSVWIDGEDDDGNPVWYVADGNNFLTLSIQLDKKALEEDRPDYKQVGIHTMTFTSDQEKSEQIIGIVESAGSGISGTILTAELIKRILVPLGRTLKRYLGAFLKRVLAEDADNVNEADRLLIESSEEASEESAEAGTEVAEGIVVAVSVAFEVVAVVISVVIIAVIIVLAFLKKAIHNVVRVYNVSDLDLELEMCYFAPGTAAATAPAKLGETAKLPKIGCPPHPPHIIPKEQVIYRADLSFLNTDELKGVGYVLRAKPSGALTNGFAVVVEIPLVGDNSIYVSLGKEDGSCETVFTEHQGKSMKETLSTKLGDYTLSIATNRFAKEQSPSPVTQEMGYFYQHLIVLEKAGI